jgi:CD63 antigen
VFFIFEKKIVFIYSKKYPSIKMGLGCGSSLIKIILFVFNLLCVIGGIALIAIGAIIIAKTGDLEEALRYANVHSVPIILIVVGSVIFCIAFFGCCGAVRESQCMTMTYAFFLFVLIVLQIVIATVIFVYQDEVRNSIEKGIREVFDHKDTNREAIDGIQTALECCGAEGPRFWPTLPKSCCDKTIADTCTFITAHQTGCIAKMRRLTVDLGNYAAYAALAIAGIELLGLIFACCLANSIKNEKRRY